MATNSQAPPSKTELVRTYVDLYFQVEERESELSELKRRKAEAMEVLFDAMETDEEKTINHAVGRLTRVMTHKATVTDEGALFDALEAQGKLQTHTKRVIRQAVCNAYVKDVETGKEEPLPGLEPIIIKSIRFTRTK